MSRKKAVVVVLGDIGRSPRMCYHSYSLANQLNHDVTIVGYLDSTPHSIITNDEHIRILPISSPPAFSKVPESIQLLFKLIWTTVVLLFALFFKIDWCCDLFLMQNPPAIPTAPICWLAARLRGALFIIDWHNYMYSILRDKYNLQNLSFDRVESKPSNEPPNDGIKKKKDSVHTVSKKKMDKLDKNERTMRHRYAEAIYALEGAFGRRADAGLCVTKAMQKDLLNAWNVPSAVFYDRPPSWKFGKISDNEKHNLFMRLGEMYPTFGANSKTNSNNLTAIKEGRVVWKEDRPLIVISSTSWTLDEDFSILLEAITKYNEVARLATTSLAEHRLPSILVVITGKGPQKEFYLEKIARLNICKVKVITPWLDAADYPRLLAAADIGVSLHTSTSGMDLPMKVVDMFGSEIPVLAKNFACISELVENEKNGYLFDTSKELQEQLIMLATGFPNHCKHLTALKNNVVSDKLDTWEATWETTVAPVLSAPENLARQRILTRQSISDSDNTN